MIAYEVGYRAQLSSRLSTSVAGFYNQYNDVRSTSVTPTTILPFYFANNLKGETSGLELSGNYQVTDAWSLHAGYTLLNEHLRVKPGQFDLSSARNETADPQTPVLATLLAQLARARRTRLAACAGSTRCSPTMGRRPGRCPAISN